MERLPSTYAGRDEETPRDHFILQLEPRFEGSTTGETFNKNGKTDILIRREKRMFLLPNASSGVARSSTLKLSDSCFPISLGDSKTAIVYFVSRKEIVPVLEEIKNSTPERSNFIRVAGHHDLSYQVFEMHLNGDKACKIRMTILAFHIPQ